MSKAFRRNWQNLVTCATILVSNLNPVIVLGISSFIHLSVSDVLCHNPFLKPHCIQSSRVLVSATTSKSTLRRHGIQAVTRVMAYVADADADADAEAGWGYVNAHWTLRCGSLHSLDSFWYRTDLSLDFHCHWLHCTHCPVPAKVSQGSKNLLAWLEPSLVAQLGDLLS
jgi:hypothetical protein